MFFGVTTRTTAQTRLEGVPPGISEDFFPSSFLFLSFPPPSFLLSFPVSFLSFFLPSKPYQQHITTREGRKCFATIANCSQVSFIFSLNPYCFYINQVSFTVYTCSYNPLEFPWRRFFLGLRGLIRWHFCRLKPSLLCDLRRTMWQLGLSWDSFGCWEASQVLLVVCAISKPIQRCNNS